jgi:cell wall-associated NlpC family hydrolase
MSTVLLTGAAVAPLNAEPRAGSEQVSQSLAGQRLECLEERLPWRRVRAADGYEGWMHRGYMLEMGVEELERRYATQRVSLGCTVCEIGGGRRALPLGAIVADDAFVESGAALSRAELAERFPSSAAAASRTAQELFEGTPYEWGGITPWGADCSGLVQATFALHGIRMPRDAHQQAELGAAVAGGLADLRAGDLLFFSDRADGRITHVALALDEHRIVHLALGRGGYAVERLDGPGDDYVKALRERFRFARRME